MMATRQVRVGVATSGLIAPWQTTCIELLASVPGVTIAAWFGGRREPTTSDDVPSLLLDLDVKDAAAEQTTSAQTLDVLLDLTRSGFPAAGQTRELWRFGFGRGLSRDLAEVALSDYVRGPGLTRVALLRDEEVICDGWVQTVSWWHPADLERVLLTPAGWPAAILLKDGLETSEERSRPAGRLDSIASTSRNNHTGVSTRIPVSVLRLAAVGRRAVGVIDATAHHDEWHVGVIDNPVEAVLSAGDLAPIHWLTYRPGHFAADPFGIEVGQDLHILYEDFDQRHGIGAIHHVTLDSAGAVSEPEPVLALDVHLSYPFLIQYEGTVFMLPEASGSGQLVLYQAFDFPRDWRPVATLLPGVPAVDASVVWFEDRWWMFAGRADRGVNHDLFIWHASDLLGPWLPHVANPVKTDARSARPGGTPFILDGRLYRPSQDVSRIYGERLIINQVDILTTTRFSEHPVKAIEPRPGSPFRDGLHTLSGAGQRTLIDGNRRRFVPDAFLHRLDR